MRNLSVELERETQAAEIKKRLEEANRVARAELSSLQSQARVEVNRLESAVKPGSESKDAG